ncbi:unnamed protein product [Anisakis simplex]|uniref:Peroxin-19 n=1 Tax=Anisakis simplex TaxID=6269 RepID=A0A0M3JY65_ANISI|nr:unnamed protein product [Anisakis simplex]
MIPSATSPAGSSSSKKTDDELEAMAKKVDQNAARRAANNFQEMLEALISVQQRALEKNVIVEDIANEEKQEAKEFLQNLVTLSHNTAKVVRGQSEDEIKEGMQALAPDGKTPFEPLFSVVQTLFSKDVMYPSIKQLYDAFPNYMKENESSLDSQTKARYERQIEVLEKICREYERNDFDEATASKEEMSKWFRKISLLMLELQSHGATPEQLTGKMPDGWQVDSSTGLPKLVDADKAAEACSVM